MFPIGSTTVRCTATDALNRQSACEFRVSVTKLPQLSRLRYMAFGDSITAGEVTFPGSTAGLTSGKLDGGAIGGVSDGAAAVAARRAISSRATRSPSRTRASAARRPAEARNRFFSALNTVRPDVVLLLDGAQRHSEWRRRRGQRRGQRRFGSWRIEAKRRAARVFIGTPVPARPNGNRTIPTIFLVDYANRMRAHRVAGRRRARRLVRGDAARRVPLHRRRRAPPERSRLRSEWPSCSSRPSRRISKCDRLVGAWLPTCWWPIA